ncbi:hypothetical protein [Pseudomonas fluorescens]|uniref:hypothetical protein n=1 Tax=Pseudomonas fluorescens TaxID=294 RepID=UPI001BEA74B5|nr:hypothetical protein [Pseudomonas fluorescens]MBT2372357.1 hypothetical protein [Pseudomonas fluorescens]
MLNQSEDRVRNAVVESLKIACNDDGDRLADFSIERDGDMLLVDQLAFTSMQLAVVLAQLELELGFNPFDRNGLNVTDIRTVNDLCLVFMEPLHAR